MINRRNFMATAASAGALAALAGCSSGGPAAGSEGDPEKGTVTFALWDTFISAMVTKNLPAFNEKHPNITVKLQVTPWGGYWTKLQTEASSGTAPDVIWMNGPNFQLYASNGQIDPLDAMIDDKQMDPTNYPKPLVDLYTYHDKLYGVPSVYNGSALWYNKAIFADLGEKIPDDSWTWDTVKTVANRISVKNKAKGLYGIAFAPSEGETTYYNTIQEAGGYVISPDGKSSGYGKPEAIAGLAYLADLMHSGASPSVKQLTDQQAWQWFGNGKAAMLYGAATSVANLAGSPQAKNLQLVRLPKDVNSQCVVHGVANCITSGSKNKAAARTLCAWFASKEFSELLGSTGSTMPPFIGSETSYLASRPEYNLQVLLDAAKAGVPYPVSKNTAAWANLEPKLLAPLWLGTKTAAEVGAELGREMDAALAKE